MRKNLIIIMLALFTMPVFAQTIESVDVSKSPNGVFKASAGDCSIEGTVLTVRTHVMNSIRPQLNIHYCQVQ